jgi:GNAT superfamily N-acetyltransferase
MSEILSDLSIPTIVGAIEANPVEYWRTCCSHLPHAELYDGPDMTWFVTDIPFAPFNQVILTRLPTHGIDARIDETMAHFEARKVPMLWSVGPSVRPADLGAYLEKRGLTDAGAMTGMAVDLLALREEAPMPSGLTIEPVSDVEMLERWRHAYTASFEMPDFAGRAFFELYARIGFADGVPFRHYVGFKRGEPVASSTLFLGAGVAGIFHVGTVLQARRQGIGAIMTLAPLCDARGAGYRIGTLYSSASTVGFNVYRRLGFQEYYKLTQYLWASETSG